MVDGGEVWCLGEVGVQQGKDSCFWPANKRQDAPEGGAVLLIRSRMAKVVWGGGGGLKWLKQLDPSGSNGFCLRFSCADPFRVASEASIGVKASFLVFSVKMCDLDECFNLRLTESWVG